MAQKFVTALVSVCQIGSVEAIAGNRVHAALRRDGALQEPGIEPEFSTTLAAVAGFADPQADHAHRGRLQAAKDSVEHAAKEIVSNVGHALSKLKFHGAAAAKNKAVVEFTTYANTNCFMHDLTYTTSVQSASACETLCALNEACAAFVWCYADDGTCHNGQFTCWQKDSAAVECLVAQTGQMPGRIAGIRLQSDEQKGFETLADTNCTSATGDVWVTEDVSTLSQCQGMCDNRSDCAAYVYCSGDECGDDKESCFEKGADVVECLQKNAGSSPGRMAGVKSAATAAWNPPTEAPVAAAAQSVNTLAPVWSTSLPAALPDADLIGVVDANATINRTSEDMDAAFEDLNHTNCPGHDFAVTYGISKERCQKLCMEHAECSAFVYCWGTNCGGDQNYCAEKNADGLPCLRDAQGGSAGFAAGIKAANITGAESRTGAGAAVA